MKFALELDRDLVPEWRVKYVDYKAGKQHIKGISRAINRLNVTPRSAHPYPIERNRSNTASSFSPTHQHPSLFQTLDDFNIGPTSHNGAEDQPKIQKMISPLTSPPVRSFPSSTCPPVQGNIVISSPVEKNINRDVRDADPNRKALERSTTDYLHPRNLSNYKAGAHSRTSSFGDVKTTTLIMYPQGPYNSPTGEDGKFYNFRSRMPDSPKSFLSTMFSVGAPLSISESRRTDADIGAHDLLRHRQNEFFKWMELELEKVETFYKAKEQEANALLSVLRIQLCEMETRRIYELARARNLSAFSQDVASDDKSGKLSKNSSAERKPMSSKSRGRLGALLDPIGKVIGGARLLLSGTRLRANPKAPQDPNNPSYSHPDSKAGIETNAETLKRPQFSGNVPYRTAKRKLKRALLESYRGMELLKSYALLNCTAFKKIQKKYTKAVDAPHRLFNLSEKVNRAWFVQSQELDTQIHSAIDLYAKYFEHGHHKVAYGKLRRSLARRAYESAHAFRNGLLFGIGTVFSIQGVISAQTMTRSPDPLIRTQTGFLLQIYAGYFLILYLFAFFCVDCCIWTRNRINYQFVFEFDPRCTVDWRELAEFPSVLLTLMGSFLWLNFSGVGSQVMYIYYPVLLIFFTVLLIFLPAPIIFHRGRKWFAYSHWRLLLAGFYPVEFRDFFLGDMYCSLTYSMANIELFFCLYSRHWTDNTWKCGSSHSHLLGFFTIIPGLWRALQCLRRYYDTRDVFPHLVNCGKYFSTVAFYTGLSLYRINHSKSRLAFFLVVAILNSIYVSVWDVLMDWSLLQPNAKNRFLRNVRGYKSVWWYYAAMILNPILRFNWIIYTIYTDILGHSTLATFLVALSEVTRRGIWVIFRVENEHCSNVARVKASRDVPLPYITCGELANIDETEETAVDHIGESTAVETLEASRSNGSNYIRRGFTKIMADAHTQDFEKKHKTIGSPSIVEPDLPDDSSSDDDEDEDESNHEKEKQVVMGMASLLLERRNGARESISEETGVENHEMYMSKA